MHSRSVAAACAMLKMDCEVHIGAVDAEKVSLNRRYQRTIWCKNCSC